MFVKQRCLRLQTVCNSSKIMVHSLTITSVATTAPSSTDSNMAVTVTRVSFPRSQTLGACQRDLDPVLDTKLVHSRFVTLSLGGIALGLHIGGSIALAARRPPPPPPEEKDPNVSGLEAKVLASKKRKEAMKEAVAKLRERGKTISEPSE